MNEALRGVNLGGWLVLERWITPSVFHGVKGTDEHSLCQQLSSQEAARRLERHRRTFITEESIRQLAELGLSVVRIPVGYWLFGDEEPFVDGADTYVKYVFEWAKKYDLKVILDFHGAPGSQNGWDHSGRAGKIEWEEPRYIAASLRFIERLTSRYGHQTPLIGVEPLNEPHWEVSLRTLVEYYAQAAGIIRRNCHSGVAVIVSDAFRPEEMSKALRKKKLDAVLDVHLYQVFSPEDRRLDLGGHLRKTDKQWARLLQGLTRHHKVLVGEWSAAMSELHNQVGQRHRTYEKADYQVYATTQREVFDRAGVSWTYWTARTEDGGVWSLLDHPSFITG